jgi:hypothetical protein
VEVGVGVGNPTEAAALRGQVGHRWCPWTTATAPKTRALCDQFKQLIQRDFERTVFHKEACQRIGEMISQSVRQGRSEYACSAPSQEEAT